MKRKVKTITVTEMVTHETSLPDGLYKGLWGGSIIEVTTQGKQYLLDTAECVKGIDIEVVVQIENGIATFDTLRS